MSKKSSPQPVHALHEFDQKGNHRIVTFDGGQPNASTWFAYSAIAYHRGFHAATDYFNGALPTGLFQVKLVHYERLGV
jgi:hypothetical protein